MKKALCMIALAAICFGTASASVPVKAAADTGKMKVKKKMPDGTKVKKKMKDTTKKM